MTKVHYEQPYSYISIKCCGKIQFVSCPNSLQYCSYKNCTEHAGAFFVQFLQFKTHLLAKNNEYNDCLLTSFSSSYPEMVNDQICLAHAIANYISLA